MEIVLGLGRQKSARDIADQVDAQLRKNEGTPRKVSALSKHYEIFASRPGFDDEFNSFTLRIHVKGSVEETTIATIHEYADVVSHSVENHWHTVECPSDGVDYGERVEEAIDKICECTLLPEVWRIEGDKYRTDPISTELLFQAMVQYKASDVHLSPGSAPVFRVDGQTVTSELIGELSATQVRSMIHEIAPERYWKEFKEHHQTSFNYHQVGLGYSRVSAFVKSGTPHCTFRFLPEVIPSFEELSVPADTMESLANLHHGLVLVTGMTGSGKSTSVAALIDWINSHKSFHILTIENPVEYVHNHKKSIISQRTTGVDVDSFSEAVRGALRHDPDVILIGEMRDSDTIRSAISAAATGHLVISTLHANTASEVVNRVVSFFDPVERDLVKLQLRDALQCVICQRLIPKIGGGRVPALEFLLNDVKPVSDGIIKGSTDLIRIGMQQTVSHSFLFEEYLLQLFNDGIIDLEHAHEFCTDESVFDQMRMGTYSVPRLDSLKEKH